MQAAPPAQRRRRATALIVGVFLAVALNPAPAASADPPAALRSDVIRCDTTGCYVAWAVVDSDRDGVSDADEIMAGTDPHDPASSPPLVHLAELGYEHKLPSFEAGLGAFLLLPVEILKARDASADLLAAFPMNDRADALTRMGISKEQLAEHGIDPGRDGFSIGLDGVGSKESLPGRRVGAVDARLISDGDVPQNQDNSHGGTTWIGRNIFGEQVHVYGDGTWTTTSFDADGTATTEYYDADDKLTGISITTVKETTDGTTEIRTETTSTSAPDGSRRSKTTTTHHRYADGSYSAQTVTTVYHTDANGEITGTRVTTTGSHTSADGDNSAFDKTVESCDKNGEECEPAPTHDDESDHVYYDPEASPVIITQEMVDGVLRYRGAAINVVPGWTAPGFEEDPDNPHSPGVVALVDSDLAAHFMLVEPLRVTKAQPEVRDDLPSPLEGAPLPGTGGCGGLC
ncbi:MAG: hypothetical protein HOV79_23685 [Hamadaea sp.]|nr:hypothetical protein [Hamadaea sp.]